MDWLVRAKGRRSVVSNGSYSFVAHCKRKSNLCFVRLAHILLVWQGNGPFHCAGIGGRQGGALATRAQTVGWLIIEDEFLNCNDLLAIAETLQMHQLQLDLVHKRLPLLTRQLAQYFFCITN